MDRIASFSRSDQNGAHLIGIDPARFDLDLPETPAEFIASMLLASPGSAISRFSSLATSGLAGTLGAIWPGAVEVLPVSAAIPLATPIAVHYDSDAQQIQVCGGPHAGTHYTWDLKTCTARTYFFSGSIPKTLLDRFFKPGDDWALHRDIASLSIGFLQGLPTGTGDLSPHLKLRAIGYFAAVAGRFHEDWRSFENHVTVTMERFSTVGVTFLKWGSLVGDRTLNPSGFIAGPMLPGLLDLCNPVLVAAGAQIGGAVAEVGTDLLRLAVSADLPRRDIRRFSDNWIFKDLRKPSAHEQILALRIADRLTSLAAAIPAASAA